MCHTVFVKLFKSPVTSFINVICLDKWSSCRRVLFGQIVRLALLMDIFVRKGFEPPFSDHLGLGD
jgi:hypothetical protein